MVLDNGMIERLRAMARRMRLKALELAFKVGNKGSHVGPGLSMIEIMATLYGGILNLDSANPEWDERDRFILSKGHGVLAYYTALAEAGFISESLLETFEENEGVLPGHPIMNPGLGIESSSGSLGMGLSLAIGSAMSAKFRKKKYRVFTLLGDGECAEGSVWEGAMAAAHYQLDNLTAIIDCNKLQYDGLTSEIMNLGDLGAKWKAFGWDVREVDGHDVGALYEAFTETSDRNSIPHLVIAHTVKGKGVAFMEGNKVWHHGRLSKDQYNEALEGLKSQADSEDIL